MTGDKLYLMKPKRISQNPKLSQLNLPLLQLEESELQRKIIFDNSMLTRGCSFVRTSEYKNWKSNSDLHFNFHVQCSVKSFFFLKQHSITIQRKIPYNNQYSNGQQVAKGPKDQFPSTIVACHEVIQNVWFKNYRKSSYKASNLLFGFETRNYEGQNY